jgi:hypothetical protein
MASTEVSVRTLRPSFCHALLVPGTVAVADGDTSLGESESATLAAQAILEWRHRRVAADGQDPTVAARVPPERPGAVIGPQSVFEKMIRSKGSRVERSRQPRATPRTIIVSCPDARLLPHSGPRSQSSLLSSLAPLA